MRAHRPAVLSLLLLAAPLLADPAPAPPAKQRPPGPGADPEAQLREAQNSYINADFRKALGLARPLTKEKPPIDQRAWRVVGSAACNLKDTAQADEAYAHLEKDAREFVRYVCTRVGVTFKDGKFRLEP